MPSLADLAASAFGFGSSQTQGQGSTYLANQTKPAGSRPTLSNVSSAPLVGDSTPFGFSAALANVQLPGGSGGYDAGAAQRAAVSREKAATEAYLADQEAMARQAQGRLGQQRQIGLGNIEGSYTTALNDLMESAAKAQRDYELTSGRNREDNVSARAATDQSVNAMSSGLQRLLGSRGAGNSSAAQILAPFAVAKQGASRLGEIQGTYGRNMQNLDTSYGDVKSEEQKQREALAREKQLKAQELESGLSQAEISILEQLSGLGLERARLNDQNYGDIRSSAQGYNNQISSLLDRINSLGSQYQGAVKPLAGVRFSAPELAQYNTSALSSGRAQQAGVPSPVADLVGQYFPTLLGREEERR